MVNGVSGSQGFSLEDLRQRQEAIQKRKEEAENAKMNIEEEKKTAEAAKADAEKVKTEAEKAVDNAKNEVTTAENSLSSKQSNYNSLSQSYSTAISRLSMLKSADPKDDKAIASQEVVVQNLYISMQDALKEVEEAKRVLEEKKANLAEAEAKNVEAEKTLEDAEQAVINTETKLNEAQKELETIEAELEIAQAEVEEAEAAEQAKETDFVPMTEADAVAAGYTVIKSVDDLLNINSNLNGQYILMCDIDLDGIDWEPIGNSESPFKGEFNGNGFNISNLKINTEEEDLQNVGFFGVTENASIKNVNLVDAQVITPNDFLTGSSSVGILAGTARGTSFDNITVSGEVVGFESVGGLVGTIDDNDYFDEEGNKIQVNNSSINNVETDVNVESSYYAGGIAGFVADTSNFEGVATKFMTISNCNTSGNITVNEESAGGIIGEAGKTIITLENCTSSVTMDWNNLEDDSDISFLMETGRIGGMIGCADGTYLTLVGCEFNGDINAEGEFQGNNYGWYMNDAQITIYDIPGGLPVDDILKIDGVDALTPSYTDGVPQYEITVSTLTGLDKMVTMIQDNPALADLITFNVNFDFEYMDGMYDASTYSQYGIVQHLYQDENGVVHNDVYIDNEIDLETTFHNCNVKAEPTDYILVEAKPTMVSGLYKTKEGAYAVSTGEGLKEVKLNFNYEDQETKVDKRKSDKEAKYKERITEMALYYQKQANNILKKLFGFNEDYNVPNINKAKYKKLLKKAEKLGGIDKLSKADQIAIAKFELDYKISNLVAASTHNEGCGMGGNASFLDKTTTYPMQTEDGRTLYTTLNGASLVQKVDGNGQLIFDEYGDAVYEYADGSGDYDGIEDVFEQRAYQKQDENGNLLFSNADGNTVTQVKDEEGNAKYIDSDGNEIDIAESQNEDGSTSYTYTDADGNEQTLTRQLTEYKYGEEYDKLQSELQSLVSDVENGKFPQAIDVAEADESAETTKDAEEKNKEEIV